MNWKHYISKALSFIINSDYRFVYLSDMGFYNNMPDEKYLKKKFKAKLGYELNLSNPQTFNEKLQWLKLNDRKPIYTTMVDKYAVKQYVADAIGDEYIIPTLGVWDRPEDIDWDSLPNQFVLKVTHDSGGLVICTDKSKLDKKKAVRKLNKSLRCDYYKMHREWPYKDVRRRVIAEKYMTDESGIELKDYKIFDFDGEPKFIQVDYNRFVEHKRNLYTTDWEYIDAAIQYPTDKTNQIKKPECLNEMLELARKLSAGIPHIRTDFYCINNKIYFGELTFYHESGMAKFTPEEFGLEVGSWLKLPSGGVLIKKNNWALYMHRKVEELTDYKFFCFGGKVKCVAIHFDRFTDHRCNYYDVNSKIMPFGTADCPPDFEKKIEIPSNMDEMIMLAERLANDIPFLRVDFYNVRGKIYFGELTFYPQSGYFEFIPDEWDKILGNWVPLPIS